VDRGRWTVDLSRCGRWVYYRHMSTLDESFERDPLGKDCFSVTTDVLDLCRRLKIPERSLIDQLRRSIVSIGSNMNEAHGAETRKFCSSKLAIAYRECRESRFQLALIAHVCPEEASCIKKLDTRLDSIAARLYTGIRTLRSSTGGDSVQHDARFSQGSTLPTSDSSAPPSDEPTD
jgi:four helix bundle protein